VDFVGFLSDLYLRAFSNESTPEEVRRTLSGLFFEVYKRGKTGDDHQRAAFGQAQLQWLQVVSPARQRGVLAAGLQDSLSEQQAHRELIEVAIQV
jgi:hypothetical protein